MVDITDVELGMYDNSKDAKPPKSLVWNALHEMAKDTVKVYKSDFYWDAIWLDKNLDDYRIFGYGFREYGTTIGTDQKVIEDMNEQAFIITVWNRDGKWMMEAMRTK